MEAGANPSVTVYETVKTQVGRKTVISKVPKESIPKQEYPSFEAHFAQVHRQFWVCSLPTILLARAIILTHGLFIVLEGYMQKLA